MSFEQIDLNQIHDEQAKRAIVLLFNLIEDLQATVRQLQEENQRLRDENNRLKGEQGKPNIKPNKRGPGPGQGNNHSSESERRKPQEWHKGRKLDKIKIDREEVLTIDRAQLPADAEFKGYKDTVVQDVVIHTDNVLYRKEKFYSPGERRTYVAELPAGYRWVVRAGHQSPGRGAVLRLQHERAQDPGVLRQRRYPALRGRVVQLVDQGLARVARRERRHLRGRLA